MQQDSRGDSCGQSRGGGRRGTQHLHLFRPQVECNRTVEEIAVDRAGEEAEEILNTYNNWIQEAISKSCSILTSQTFSNIGYSIKLVVICNFLYLHL